VVADKHAPGPRVHAQHLVAQEGLNSHFIILRLRAGDQLAGVVVKAADIIWKAARAVGKEAAPFVNGDFRAGIKPPELGSRGHTGRHAANDDCPHSSALLAAFAGIIECF